jgi:hypothetical protein
LEVKSLSDARPVIKEIKIDIDNGQLVKGAINLIQLSTDDSEDAVPKPLPPAKKEEKLIGTHFPLQRNSLTTV